MMQNLLKETIYILEKNGKSLADIKWFGTKDFVISESIERLFNFSYDNGFGGNEIPMELILVGKDFWIERHEYDGSEWWEYKTIPKKPKKSKSIGNLTKDLERY